MGIQQGRARPRAKPIVYQAINLINGKKYIGVTMYSLGARRSQHIWDALNLMPKGSILHKAIRKYGPDNIKFSIISRHQTYEEAKDEEVRLIALLKPEYNQGRGGEGNAGWHHSLSVVEGIRARMKENPINYWKGKKLPPHVVAGMVERQSQPEAREKWEQYRAMGPAKVRKAVICLDDGMEFESARAAGLFYGINPSSIAVVAKDVPWRRTAGGRVFRFLGADYGGAAEATAIREAASLSQKKVLGQRHGKGRAVVCITDNNRIFATVKSAADYYGVLPSNITSVCRNRRHVHSIGGHKFKYLLGDDSVPS